MGSLGGNTKQTSEVRDSQHATPLKAKVEVLALGFIQTNFFLKALRDYDSHKLGCTVPYGYIHTCFFAITIRFRNGLCVHFILCTKKSPSPLQSLRKKPV